MRAADGTSNLLLMTVVALGATWSLGAGALAIPACVGRPLLRCGTSAYNNVDPWATAMLVLGLLAGYAVFRRIRGVEAIVLGYAVAFAVVNRAFRYPQLWISDVIDATREALGVMSTGANPYLHDYLTTNPQHSPFPYLPGELFFYGIPYVLVHSVDTWGKVVGIATVFVLASLAPVVGTARAALCVALYGTFELAAATSVDGTNDIGAAFVLLASAVLLAWSDAARERGWQSRTATALSIASAVFLAWAMLYKATTWPFFPFFALYLWRRDRREAIRSIALVAVLCIAAIVPFLFPDPSGFVLNVYRGFVFNEYFYGLTIWTGLTNAGVPIDASARFISILFPIAVIGTFLVLIAIPARTVGGVLARGTAVIATALLFAHFATSSYYAFAGALFIGAVALAGPREEPAAAAGG
jgi:hypothetical protein